LTNQRLLAYVGVLVLIEFILLAIFQSTSPIYIATTLVTDSSSTNALAGPSSTEYAMCGFRGSSLPHLAALLIYKVILLGFGTFVGIRTRNVASQFNESKNIALSLYNVIVVTGIIVAAIFLLQAVGNMLIVLLIIVFFVIPFVTMLLTSTNKFMTIYTDEKAKKSMATKTGASQSRLNTSGMNSEMKALANGSNQVQHTSAFLFPSMNDFPQTVLLDRYIRLLEKQLKRARKRCAQEGIKFGANTAGRTQVTATGGGDIAGGSEFEVVSMAPADMPKSALRSGFHEPVGPPPRLKSSNQSFSLGPPSMTQTQNGGNATLRKVSVNIQSRQSINEPLRVHLPPGSNGPVSTPGSPPGSYSSVNNNIQPHLLDPIEISRQTSEDPSSDYSSMISLGSTSAQGGSTSSANNTVRRSQSLVGQSLSNTLTVTSSSVNSSPQLAPAAVSSQASTGSSMRPTSSQGLSAQLSRVQSSASRRSARPVRNVIPVHFRSGASTGTSQTAASNGALPPIHGVVSIDTSSSQAAAEENHEEH